MATQPLLAELLQAYEREGGVAVLLESVGGVDAARRLQAGEVFDVVVLAGDAMASLAKLGLLTAPRPVADSRVAVAVRAGTPLPDLSTDAALGATLLGAARIGYSTGPSGRALLQLIERLGLHDVLQPRLVQARPGLPVGTLVTTGEVDLGFQQFSELQGVPGLVLTALPAGLEIVTTFSAAIGVRSGRPERAQALLDFLTNPATAPAKRAHGMDAPAAP